MAALSATASTRTRSSPTTRGDRQGPVQPVVVVPHRVRLRAGPDARSVRLVFEGVNYRADVWLNGSKVAGRSELAGAYRVSSSTSRRPAPRRQRARVEVFPPQPGEFTIGFVDWNPEPPDRNMGIFRPVKLRATGRSPSTTRSFRVRSTSPPWRARRSRSRRPSQPRGKAGVGRGRRADRRDRVSKEFALQPHEKRRSR